MSEAFAKEYIKNLQNQLDIFKEPKYKHISSIQTLIICLEVNINAIKLSMINLGHDMS